MMVRLEHQLPQGHKQVPVLGATNSYLRRTYGSLSYKKSAASKQAALRNDRWSSVCAFVLLPVRITLFHRAADRERARREPLLSGSKDSSFCASIQAIYKLSVVGASR